MFAENLSGYPGPSLLISQICVISSLRRKADKNYQFSRCNSPEDRSYLPRFACNMRNSDNNRRNYMLQRYLTLYPYDSYYQVQQSFYKIYGQYIPWQIIEYKITYRHVTSHKHVNLVSKIS